MVRLEILQCCRVYVLCADFILFHLNNSHAKFQLNPLRNGRVMACTNICSCGCSDIGSEVLRKIKLQAPFCFISCEEFPHQSSDFKELFTWTLKVKLWSFMQVLDYLCISYAIVLCLCYVFMHIYVDLALNYREIRPDHPVLSWEILLVVRR